MCRLALLLFLFLACVAGPAAEAQSAHPRDDPHNFDINLEMRCLTLPAQLALPLLPGLRSAEAKTQSAALAKLEELVNKGEAKVVGWPSLTLLSGKKATVDCQEEIRYATEFEPAATSIYLTDKDGAVIEKPEQTPATRFSATATAFDTRYIGVFLEAEATLNAEHDLLEVSFTGQHVRLESVDKVVIEHEFTTEKRTEKIIQEQPRFSTLKVVTTLSMRHGEQKLIGAFHLPKQPATMELFLLGAEIVPLK